MVWGKIERERGRYNEHMGGKVRVCVHDGAGE